jgi:hypothetical protein
MALNNFANLTASMQAWAVDRPDLVPQFQDCIDLAINDINAVLRMPDQQTTVQLVCDSTGQINMPDDFLEIRRVTWLGNPRKVLGPLSPEGEAQVYPAPYGSPPMHYDINDDTMVVQPLDSVTPIEIMYWAKVPKLTPIPPNDTNWLLQKYSNIILFGAMKYVEVFKRNDKGMQTFGQLYSAEVDGLVRTGKRSQWGRSRMRVAGRSTP